jgi:holo-ACP synthase CitX
MRYDESRRSFLAARDARQAELERQLRSSTAAPSLVTLSLGIPGLDKTPAGSGALFAWAARRLAEALPGAKELLARPDALGPFAIWAATGAPAQVKERCLAIEAASPAARLVDLDVYAPDGSPVDRASLGLPPRGCLCCGAPARECIRLSRHPPEEIVSSAHELLTLLSSSFVLANAIPGEPEP